MTPSKIPADAIREHLQRVLDSGPFRTSKRSSAFLRYVVEAVCEGRAGELKERTIGTAVFDREPDYDTNQDPVVRTTAGDVRKRLAQYYLEAGADEPMRIQLAPGSYAPEIDRVEAEAAPVEPRRGHLPWMVGAAVLAGVAGWFLLQPRPGVLDRFWAPLFERNEAIILCMGQPRAYTFAAGWRERLDEWFENGGPPRDAPGSIPLADVQPAWTRYLSLNDVQTMTRLIALFARNGVQTEVRGGRLTTLGDLRGKPTVLVGAFNNDWTLKLTGELRYTFEEDRAAGLEYVRDRQNPEKRDWAVDVSGNRPVPEDYAIVSRVLDPTTERPMVVAAGIFGPATRAAGEFLTNTRYFAEALGNAPSDWYRKNIQVILAARVIAGNPGPPRVVAAHFW